MFGQDFIDRFDNRLKTDEDLEDMTPEVKQLVKEICVEALFIPEDPTTVEGRGRILLDFFTTSEKLFKFRIVKGEKSVESAKDHDAEEYRILTEMLHHNTVANLFMDTMLEEPIPGSKKAIDAYRLKIA